MNEITSQVPPAPPSVGITTAPTAPTAPLAPPAALPARRLRLWPGVAILALQWLVMLVPGWVAPENAMLQFMARFWAPMVAAGAVVAWWLFASRLRWADRLLGVGVGVAAWVAAVFLCDPSFPFALILYTLPAATTAWVLWLLVTPFFSWPIRRAGLVVVMLMVWGGSTLLRFDGIDGSMSASMSWRWSKTAEQVFLDELAGKDGGERAPTALVREQVVLQPGDWPGFRGPDRDGRLTGVRIATDWSERPPQEVWRHRIGPGWSSFAVIGDRLFTQEQRGKNELVVCYSASTGEQIWAHEDATRFSEVVAGAGPRATPTFHSGKLYTLGASGRLNCLDAATGRVLWWRDIVEDSGAKVPQWGFSSSPLVAQGVVTVFAGGPDGKSVLGYHATRENGGVPGQLAWSAGEGQFSYCSPQLARLHGKEQVLIATDAGLAAFHPTRGKVLWEHHFPMGKGQARVVQPAVVGSSDVLVGGFFGVGTRRVKIGHGEKGWTDEEVWTTQTIKPYYNDLVIHKGHLYGFDNIFFTCVNLEDGQSRWRARGHANGQVLLLADQGLLLVLSEKGEVALLEASPEQHKVLGRFQALSRSPELKGKTWNHPVVAHGKLYVRNGVEIACYQLSTTGSATVAGR